MNYKVTVFIGNSVRNFDIDATLIDLSKDQKISNSCLLSAPYNKYDLNISYPSDFLNLLLEIGIDLLRNKEIELVNISNQHIKYRIIDMKDNNLRLCLFEK
jgi:hypothetical protein